MRTRLLCLCLVGFVFAGVPPSAEAHARGGIWWWLDGLSGPDDFSGWKVADVSFLCYDAPRDNKNVNGRLHVNFACRDADRKRLRLEFGAKAAWLGGNNTLTYASGSPPDVSALILMGTVDVGLDKRGIVDAGVAIGGVRFSTDPAGFWRPAIEPRLTITPLVCLGRHWEWLQFQFSALGILGKIDSADFGASEGYRASGEFIPTAAVFFDLGTLLR